MGQNSGETGKSIKIDDNHACLILDSPEDGQKVCSRTRTLKLSDFEGPEGSLAASKVIAGMMAIFRLL